MRLFTLLVFLLILPSSAFAEDSNAVIGVGVVVEMAKRPYTFIFLSGETLVAGQPFQLQYDRFDRGLERLWLNYSAWRLVNEKNVTVSYQPGIFVNSRGAWYIGGSLLTKVKPLNLVIWQRSGGGNRGAFHLWISRIQLTKELFLQHSLKMQDGIPATSYLGPGVSLTNGQLMLWGGRSLTSDPTWSINVKIQFRF